MDGFTGRARAVIGRAWGATTTVVISVGMALMAAKADPELAPYLTELTAMAPWLPKVVAVVGSAAVLLRLLAPPPKE